MYRGGQEGRHTPLIQQKQHIFSAMPFFYITFTMLFFYLIIFKEITICLKGQFIQKSKILLITSFGDVCLLLNITGPDGTLNKLNSSVSFQKSRPGYSRISTELVVSCCCELFHVGTFFFFPYHLTEGRLNLFLDERPVLATAWDVNIISILLSRAVLLASLATSPLIRE